MTKAQKRKLAIFLLARKTLKKDGELEFDLDARVFEGGENGAYVQAWAWVDFAGTHLDKEAA